MSIYLDNSATTKPCLQAKEKMIHMLENCWGNPSSFHSEGIKSFEELEWARETVARSINAQSEEIYFTPGGTYSNNIAIFGTVNALKRRGNKIVTTSVEHPSVENAMKNLENQGFNVVRLPVDESGKISKRDLMNEIDENTILVSVMMVNNEVGSIMPVESIKKIITAKKSPALFHCDAVQGFGKIKINTKTLGADLISVSSHKIHGPKGVGALYIKKGVRIVSPIFGGGQEKDVAPGTQGMPAICGFAAAVECLPKNPDEECARLKILRDSFVEKLGNIQGVTINSSADALPYIINISVHGIPSQPMITYLSQEGICVSGGSACAKGHRSSVLGAMGVDPVDIDSALRISLSRFTTEDELNTTADVIKTMSETLRKSR